MNKIHSAYGGGEVTPDTKRDALGLIPGEISTDGTKEEWRQAGVVIASSGVHSANSGVHSAVYAYDPEFRIFTPGDEITHCVWITKGGYTMTGEGWELLRVKLLSD